ncbi:hypothetical protein [Nitrolancea hollandica]|uniref:Uncharacterized protein n=1 Tax=Nitrolancea hollandica Lb TaxID=1129897 RepID=I4ELN1_9BACT|nr:hypothetical protein [Nitrolancea hollandica]CCF85593.1 hypothetical protein NITHO_5180004 [Nitrolancea hollandica Lb]
MANIPMDDILPLWNETKQHKWSAFQKTLEQHRGKAEGIEDYLVDLMLVLTRREEQSNSPFPNSPQQLYEVLNRRLEQELR